MSCQSAVLWYSGRLESMSGHSDLDPLTSNHQNHSEPISAPTIKDLETNKKNNQKPRNVCKYIIMKLKNPNQTLSRVVQ